MYLNILSHFQQGTDFCTVNLLRFKKKKFKKFLGILRINMASKVAGDGGGGYPKIKSPLGRAFSSLIWP